MRNSFPEARDRSELRYCRRGTPAAFGFGAGPSYTHLLLSTLVLLCGCAPGTSPTTDDDDSIPDDDDSAPGDDDDSAPGDDDDDAGPPPAEPSSTRSSLYPLDWTPELEDEDGRFVHDFSYAGYRRGEVPIPDVIPGPTHVVTQAPWSADPTGELDATDAIQGAIDAAGEAGGGLVVLPPGTYRVSRPDGASATLRVRHSGVVLRGAGRDATFLFNDTTEMRNAAVIRIGPTSSASWTDESAGVPVALAQDADERATSVLLANTTGFAVGDDIVVRADAGPEWIEEHGMTGRWTAGVPGPTFHRTVAGVEGDALLLDIPLRYSVLMRDGARVYPSAPHLREIGLEDFSLGMARHEGTGWGDNDYSSEGTGAYAVHGADAVRFAGVVDGWVRRVGTYAEEGNGGVHMLSDGVVVAQSRNITVQEASFSHPQYEGGGGNGYSFVLQGSDSLFVDCSAVSARHAFSWKKSYSSGNVVLRGSSSDPRLATDFHMHLSMSNLVDDTVLEGDLIDATYRPWGTVEHGFTTAHSVLWRTTGLDDGDGPGVVVDSRQYDWGVVAGTRGPVQGIRTTPIVDTLSTAPEDLAEFEGGAGVLAPRSLHLDQVARRLTGEPLPTAVPGHLLLTRTAEADGHVRGGSFSDDVYDGAESLQVKAGAHEYTRHAFIRFDLSDIEHRVSRAVLRVEARTSDGQGDVGELRVHSAGDDWNPAELSWSNQPELGPAGARVLTGPEWTEHLLDVTEAARGLEGGSATFAITQTLEDGRNVAIRAVESGAPASLELVLDDAISFPIVSVDGDPADDETSLGGVVDGDLDTRWSNDSFGAGVTVDLGVARTVTRVDIAFFRGEHRLGFAELRASTDGSTFVPLRSVRSSGESSRAERFDVAPTTARWIRVVGFGNSENAWNSWSEVAVYGE